MTEMTVLPEFLAVRVPAGTVEIIDKLCARQGIGRSALLRQALVGCLADHGEPIPGALLPRYRHRPVIETTTP